MQITDKFEIVKVAEIKPDEHNARKHSDEQICSRKQHIDYQFKRIQTLPNNNQRREDRAGLLSFGATGGI